jgi:hypothetical protein
VWGELTSEEQAAITSLLDALLLPADACRHIQGLRAVIESAAVARRARRPPPRDRAVEAAADDLGVEFSAHCRRVLRWAEARRISRHFVLDGAAADREPSRGEEGSQWT